VEQFRNRPLQEGYPHVWLDATYLKVRQNHRVVSMAFVIAVGVDENGEGSYSFLLSAVDADKRPGLNTDLIRIMIWNSSNGQVVYDNMMGEDQDADPVTEVEGGNIVIHSK
jgi:hypothetical protein